MQQYFKESRALLGIASTNDPMQGTIGFWKSMIVGIMVAVIMVMWRVRTTVRKILPRAPPLPSV